MRLEDEREIRALRDRLARLSEAGLRINESLDLDSVLQGVLDSARALTGALYGVIAFLDGPGRLQEFLSSGMDPGQAEQLWELPEGTSLFEYLSTLQEPLRLPDFHSHTRSLGLPEFHPPMPVSPALSFLAAPIRHRGESVGNIFLAEKENGAEFTREDEESLVTFAFQAALVIANARRHRDERRARNDLETLIDTAPVGVAVFDARTGAPLSFNQEALRILESLREPGCPPEQLLQLLTVRRAGGREIPLREHPMAHALSAGDAVRAEEVVLSVRDGQNVTVLVNATPMQSEEGAVETFLVTFQDMTPLEEVERLRAEFLAMVSHELRTPLAAIKGSVATLLNPAAALSPVESLEFFRIIDSQTDRMRALLGDLLDVARIETAELSVSPEPSDLAALANEAGNAFRASGSRHRLVLEFPSDLPWGMADRARIGQVLGNLLSNAARHSPESSTIRLGAVREEFQVALSVSDEGTGITAESLPRLFRKFARPAGERQSGDTGLGLAVCRGIVEAHGGRIWAESDGLGLGARFTFTVPTVDESGHDSAAMVVEPSTGYPQRDSSGRQMRILAVDDDPQALRYTQDAVTRAGFAVVATGEPNDAIRLVQQAQPHLVLMDVMLPGADGIDLMQDITGTDGPPVIFVSAYGQDDLVARAFEAGAADYVVKPFSPTELVARIRAALRRRESPIPAAPYVLGDLAVNYTERTVTLAGQPVRLTALEFRTLAELSANAGRLLTYEQLMRRVWGTEDGLDLRPMRTVISTLRHRLSDDADNPTYIFTEPRVGYRMPKGEAS